MKWYKNKLNFIAFLVGAAIIGYVFFMFISGFVSMSGLQTTLLEQARIETERRSAALAAFFAERRDDLGALAFSLHKPGSKVRRSGRIGFGSQVLPTQFGAGDFQSALCGAFRP